MSITIFITQPNGAEEELNANEDQTLLECVQGAGLDGFVGECGGNCACGTCHCYIDFAPQGTVLEATNEELQMLDFVASPREENSRLACQIRITSEMQGMRITMPDRQF